MKKFLLKSILIIILKILKITLKLLSPKDIKSEKNSSLRIFLINFTTRIQNLFLKNIKFPLDIIRTKNEDLFVNVGGIYLDTSSTFRYFKLTEDIKYFNQGEAYSHFFKNTKMKVFVDIGSHVGEISLYIAKNFSQSNIFSIEGSPQTYKIQEKNITYNKLNNINLFNYIVSDKNSEEYISKHLGTENYSINVKRDGFIKNTSIKLDDFFSKNNINEIDFLKIDIEGSIPKISKELIKIWNNKIIHYCALSFEKNSYESYEKIVESLSRNSLMYEIDPNTDLRKKINKEYLIQNLKNRLGTGYQSNRFDGMEVVFERIN